MGFTAMPVYRHRGTGSRDWWIGNTVECSAAQREGASGPRTKRGKGGGGAGAPPLSPLHRSMLPCIAGMSRNAVIASVSERADTLEADHLASLSEAQLRKAGLTTTFSPTRPAMSRSAHHRGRVFH